MAQWSTKGHKNNFAFFFRVAELFWFPCAVCLHVSKFILQNNVAISAFEFFFVFQLQSLIPTYHGTVVDKRAQERFCILFQGYRTSFGFPAPFAYISVCIQPFFNFNYQIVIRLVEGDDEFTQVSDWLFSR